MRLFHSTIIVLIIRTTPIMSYFEPETGDKIKALCVKEIFEKYKEIRNQFVYISTNPLIDEIADLVTNAGSTMCNLNTNLKTNFNTARFIIVLINSIEDLEKYINEQYRTKGFNSYAKYLFVVLKEVNLHDIFTIIWSTYLMKIVVIDNVNNAYTASGIRSTCGASNDNTFIFNCNAINFTKVTSIYKRSWKEFSGCEIKALALRYPPYVIDVHDPNNMGMEPTVFAIASTKLNFKMNFVPHNYTVWGNKLLDGNYTEMAGSLYRGEARLMFGSFRSNATFLEDFDSTIPFFQSELCFYVPAAKRLERWVGFIRTFDTSIWITIIVSLLIYVIIAFIIGKFAQKPEGYNNFNQCIQYYGMMLIGKPTSQPKYFLFRCLFLSWTLFAYLFSCSYENTFLSFLVRPLYEKQIKTIEGIVDSGLNYGGSAVTRALFSETNKNPYYEKLYSKWILCPVGISCTNRTSKKRDMANIVNTRLVDYYTKDYYLDKDGRLTIYKMPISLTYFPWFVMVKGFPLKDSFNEVIRSLWEAGILEKINDDLSYKNRGVNSNPYIPLSIEDFKLLIYIYFVGICIALIVFCYEFFGIRIRKKYWFVIPFTH